MFTTLLRKVTDRTVALEHFLGLYNPGAATVKHREDHIFRHSAVMTQLYNIYESFSESVLSLWLSRLPRYGLFPDLSEQFRNAYRSGIARIIKNIDKRQYRHLSLVDILTVYLNSLQGNASWELVNDALTSHDANLRRSQFDSMFSSVGLDNIWHLLETNPIIATHLAETDAHESLEQMLLNLVNFRNDASHGTPDEILGLDTLTEWIWFVRTFCNALVDVVTHRIVSAEAEHRPLSVLGVVTDTFSNNVLVATCQRGPFRVGDNIYFLRDADCKLASIESLQMNGIDKEEVQIDGNSVEVGFRTSIKIHRNARLVRIEDP